MLSVMCTVHKGDFPIGIKWTLNKQPVKEIDGINVMLTNKRISQLSIETVSAEHAGEYECVAKNAAGISSHKANLSVNGKSDNRYKYFVFILSFTFILVLCFYEVLLLLYLLL